MVVMSATEEELKRLLVPKNGGPRERRISLVVRIRIAHVRPLDQTFDEEEIVLWSRHTSVRVGLNGSWSGDIPCTALRRRAEASFSAMAVGRCRTGRRRGGGDDGRLQGARESKHSPIIRRNDHV